MENKKLSEDQLDEVTGGLLIEEKNLETITGGVKKPAEEKLVGQN